MIQPLNYCPKAIEQFRGYERTASPVARIAFRYLVDKLQQAQAFLLPDHGELLDRGKPRPEMPGIVLKPPFPVTALEYTATPTRNETPGMTLPCPKRIALAWEWTDDLPAALAAWTPSDLGPGVVVAALVFIEESQSWVPVSVAAHFAYEDEWMERPAPNGALHQAMIDSRRIAPKVAASRAYPFRPVGLLPEAIGGVAMQVGQAAALDMFRADLMDELNAWTDFTFAMACKNVTVEKLSAPSKLNAQRVKAGKQPLFDYHVLKLAGGPGERGPAVGERTGASPRPHLRRGHIRHLRHLGPDRITWVNAAMVRGSGRGFARKDYAVEGARP